MSNRKYPEDDLPVSSLDVDEESPHYTTGYRKPPLHTRFKPGNKAAAGRRKKPASLTTDILRVLSEKSEVVIKGKKRKMSNRELIARRTVQDALSGKSNAIRAIRLLLAIGNENEQVIPEHKISIRFVPPMSVDDPRRLKLLKGPESEDED
ncbi:DUF5681 domain-containing protein [Sphingopyxis fribergensis]